MAFTLRYFAEFGSFHYIQVAQLWQRARAAKWVSSGRRYYADNIGLSSTTVT